jgi:signal transduction histidine kinase
MSKSNPSQKLSDTAPLQFDELETSLKRLAHFINENVDLIVSEWERFARTLTPASTGMTPVALRDHIRELLAFAVSDMGSSQTAEQQKKKSHGDKKQSQPITAAQTHAALRLAEGFDINQMVSEYRALRASVLKLWSNSGPAFDAEDIRNMTRFNEAIDQQIAESVRLYTAKMDQSKDLITGILGHDLRGPLQAIMISAELVLRMGQPNDNQIMLVNKVIGSATRMSDLVTNLLDITRVRFGSGLQVARATMDVGVVARQIVNEVRAVNPRRAIELNISGDLVGEWDKVRIEQVFSNLLNNAIQYGLQESPVRVDIEGGPKLVTLTVSNDGVPIPPKKIGTIFDPLKRLLSNEDSLPAPENLGLGLYIAKEVVVAHGGTISVTSSKKKGTVFMARFPRSN